MAKNLFTAWLGETNFQTAVREKAEEGWVKVTWTRPEIKISPEKSFIPFRRTFLSMAIACGALNNLAPALTNYPLRSREPYYGR